MIKPPLPDVNFWLALSFRAHVHHPAALAWFESLTDEVCCFCRLTQIAFLRLANNPKAFPDQAVSVAQAWSMYDTMLGDPRIAVVPEPLGLEAAWRETMCGQVFSPKLWNDAYLAGFAFAGGYRVVTFDRGFKQYQHVESLLLT